MYAAYTWDRVTYGDCVREAGRHRIEGWTAYPQGSSQALVPGASFLAVPGGVIQFKPTAGESTWCSLLHTRMAMRNAWNTDPDLPEYSNEWPLYITHHDQRTLYSNRRFPGVSTAGFLADLVERTPDRVLLITPPGGTLTNIEHWGTACRDAIAVYPLTPLPDRDSIVVFLDGRQVSVPVTHILLAESTVEPIVLIRFLGLHAPRGCKISFWPRAGDNGLITLAEGDVVTFGYLPEDITESSDDDSSEAGHDSDSDGSPPPADNTSGVGNIQGAASPSQGLSGSAANNVHARSLSRSRSRSRSGTPRETIRYLSAFLKRHGTGLLRVSRKLFSGFFPDWLGGQIHASTKFPLQAHYISDGPHTLPLLPIEDLGTMVAVLGVPRALRLPWEDKLLGLTIPQPTSILAQVPGKTCKLLNAPQGLTLSERLALHALRRVTTALGGDWPFTHGIDEDLTLEDGTSSLAGSTDDATVQWVSAVVLKPLYVPETMTIVVQFPATLEEITHTAQNSRDVECARAFPHLMPASPLPSDQTIVLLGAPRWQGLANIVCINLLHIDGRLYATELPDYVDRQGILMHADLPPQADVHIFVGTDDMPLAEGVRVHVTQATTFTLLPPDVQVPPVVLPSLAFMSGETWRPESAFQLTVEDGRLCLVLRYGFRLFSFDAHQPWRYRQQLALAIGVSVSDIAIYPSVPKVTDACVDGIACQSVLLGVSTQHVAVEWRSFLLYP